MLEVVWIFDLFTHHRHVRMVLALFRLGGFCLESVLVWWLWFGAICKARLVCLVCLAWSFVIGQCSNLVLVLSKRKLFCIDHVGGNIWICLSYHLKFKINICSFFWFLFGLEFCWSMLQFVFVLWINCVGGNNWICLFCHLTSKVNVCWSFLFA